MYKHLEKKGFAAASIHGNKSQGQRDRALEAFKQGKVRVLLATHVAARGLDIPAVRHVYNYDLPNVAENYVHRIGRTARAGADGCAVALVAPDEMIELQDIEKAMKETIPVASGRRWEVQPGQKKRPNGGTGGGRRGSGGRPQGAKPAGGKPGGFKRRNSGGGGGRSGGKAAG
jgi:ATP-dependent RNA helicase RhlE